MEHAEVLRILGTPELQTDLEESESRDRIIDDKAP